MALVAMTGMNVFGMQAGQGTPLRLAEGDAYSLALRGGVMVQSGEARELVFDGDHQLSELIWDISGLVLVGGSVSAAIGPSLQLNAGGWVGITKGNGTMQDYDWFVEGLDWTHYSDGDVDINEAYAVDVNGAYTFYRGSGVEVYGILGYKRLFWDWSEYGRKFIYSVNGFRDTIGSSGGVNGIDYEQVFDVPYAGVGARILFGKSCGTAYVLYSPFAQAEDRDHHIVRSLKYKETFENIDYIGAGGDLTFHFTDTVFATFSVDAHVIPEVRGDMEITDAGGDRDLAPGAAGIESSVVSMALAVGLRL
jgi:outer membrane protease